MSMSQSQRDEGVTVHRPLEFFANPDAKTCLVVLNSRWCGLEAVLEQHWDKFTVHACADGGSNSLFDAFPRDREKYIPHFICGDLDSARPEVLKYYEGKGTSIVCLDDQDHTDFTKTLLHLLRMQKIQFSQIYSLNAAWGRFDQTLANINTLYASHEELGNTALYLMSEDSLMFILTPGDHVICVDSGYEEGHCGLVPLGEPCQSCTTTGLQWSVTNCPMKLGGLISTNNKIEAGAKRVTVKTSHSLLWTMSHTLIRQAGR